MAKVYGVDVYALGRWKGTGREFATKAAAIEYGADVWSGHFHVWFDGDCVYDSRPGEPEPGSEPAPAPVARVREPYTPSLPVVICDECAAADAVFDGLCAACGGYEVE